MPQYFISTEPALLDHDFIARGLRTTYWAADRPKGIIEKSLASSLCFGAYVLETKEQVGFARVVTDRATFAWICDVFVDPAHRARGLGKRLMSEIVAHPDLATTAMYLATQDAHGLYERYGFARSELMRRPRSNLPKQNLQSAATKRIGFTLVELLIVIAILAALLLPVLSRAKAAGLSAACQSNLHQIGIALNLYTDQYQLYPSWTQGESPQVANWDYSLLAFTGRNTKLFLCMSNRSSGWSVGRRPVKDG